MKQQTQNNKIHAPHKNKRKTALISVILILGSVFLIQSTHDLIKILQSSTRILTLENNIQSAQIDNSELKENIAYYQSEEYIETEARNKLMMKKNGESLYQVDTNQINTQIQETQSQNQTINDSSVPLKWKKFFFVKP